MKKHRIFRRTAAALAAAALAAAGVPEAVFAEEASESVQETETEAEIMSVTIPDTVSAVLYVNNMNVEQPTSVFDVPEDMLPELAETLEKGIDVKPSGYFEYPDEDDLVTLGCYDGEGFITATFLVIPGSDGMFISWEGGVGQVVGEAEKAVGEVIENIVNPKAGEDETEAETEAETAAPDTGMAWTTTNFAAKLIDDIREHDDTNVLVSGPSVRGVLGMLYHGTDGTSKQTVESFIKSGIEQYTQRERKILESWKGTGLTFASLILKSEGVELKDAFTETVGELYGTKIVDVTEPADEEESENSDNAEVPDDILSGNIRNALESEKHATLLDVAGAATFDGEWETPFDADLTETGVFTESTGEKTEVPMMRSTETVGLENSQAKGFMKPYAEKAEDGSPRFWFVGILPEQKVFSLERLELEELMDSAKTGESIEIEMPRLSMTSDLTITRPLSRCGLGALFMNEADLSGMTDSVVRISEVFAKAELTVDEGAAAGGDGDAETESEESVTEGPAEETEDGEAATLSFNRPFVLGIYDSQTGEFPFLGRVDRMPRE